MNLFDDITSPKDQSTLEPLGNEPTAPIRIVVSIDERNELKRAMKLYYGDKVKEANYSDLFVDLIQKYLDESTDS